jgi:hypothetical protein
LTEQEKEEEKKRLRKERWKQQQMDKMAELGQNPLSDRPVKEQGASKPDEINISVETEPKGMN